MNPEFYRNKRILITGHNGFLGSWLFRWLSSMGSEVYGLDLKSDAGMFNNETLRHDECDVLNLEDLKIKCSGFKPQIVFHLAAQPLVFDSYKNPSKTFATNVLGTSHILDALRESSQLRSIVIFSSDKCYAPSSYEKAYSEKDTLGGEDPYSSSKACVEILSHAYWKSYFEFADVGLVTIRAGNLLGGGDVAQHRLIPDIMRSFFNHETLQIRRPAAKRPWQHVLDAIYGCLLIVEKLWGSPQEYSGPWNLGAELHDVKNVQWIVESLISLWGEDLKWVRNTSSLKEEEVLLLDCTKARKVLGWFPRLNLEATLEWTVSWYKSFKDGQDMEKVTYNQVCQYQKLLGL